MRRRKWWVLNTIAVGLVLACATGPAVGPGAEAPGGQEHQPKVLTIAKNREPSTIEGFSAGANLGNSGEVRFIAHNYLAVQTEKGVSEAQLAQDQISTEKGTWLLNPDGTMDVTWRIRPNVRWQDGTPFTADDLLFAWQLNKDPDLPTGSAATMAMMESADAPDPSTLKVHWSRPFIRADAADGLNPLPKHLLGDLYQSQDRDTFVNSPLFSTGFVGLGPYRLTRWERGSFMEFEPFSDYFRGPPPLDKVVVRFYGDTDVMVASILAEASDIVLPPIDIEAALKVQEGWKGSGNTVRQELTGGLRYLDVQYRPDVARPRGTLADPRTRQGLYQAIDRETFVGSLVHGLAPIADSWIAPTDGYRAALENSIPGFPYDPGQARALLAQVGWAPGRDGTLVRAASGDRFELNLRALNGGEGGGKGRELAVIADFWKSIGVEPALDLAAIGLTGDRAYEATRPGVTLAANVQAGGFYAGRFHSKYLASDANRWTGANLGGYSSPSTDALFDRYNVTIDPRQQIELVRQLVREMMGSVVLMPLYWEVSSVLMLERVKQDFVGSRTAYRFYDWDVAA